MTENPVGLTKTVGWEIGVRRTVQVPVERVWKILTSDEGVAHWLGKSAGTALSKGAAFQLTDGASARVTVVQHGSHLRLQWHPAAWEHASTIQVRVIANGDKTVIAFHQEHIPDAPEREERRRHFITALDALEAML